jgi:phospholipid/cholesterol/gamma-HCH transport system substrate-binding protein
MTAANSAASNLDASAKQMRQTITEASAPDKNGVTAGTNIRESLSNVNTLTANMADDTEALKHNFLLRGFFHRRGYFDLTHIEPDSYRKDRMFTNPQNTRTWLPADQIFERSANGAEQLTSRGRSLLDAAVAAFGDSLVSKPIVIEGYSSGGSASEGLSRSRRRAVLVRLYLQNLYQLDASHVGVVPMRDLPPRGLDHTNWDGICIVVVAAKA